MRFSLNGLPPLLDALKLFARRGHMASNSFDHWSSAFLGGASLAEDLKIR